MADRFLLSEALEQVTRLVEAFPNGGAGAGRGYIGALASTLCQYPKSIAMRCCEPVSGVARETRFLPTVADVVAWCERELEEMRRPVDREDRDAQMRAELLDRIKADDALQADRATRPSYDELKAKFGPDWGISQVDPHAPNRDFAKAEIAAATAELRRRENEAAGLPADSPVSAALLKVMKTSKYGTIREAAE